VCVHFSPYNAVSQFTPSQFSGEVEEKKIVSMEGQLHEHLEKMKNTKAEREKLESANGEITKNVSVKSHFVRWWCVHITSLISFSFFVVSLSLPCAKTVQFPTQ
jgi:hypothetical protein